MSLPDAIAPVAGLERPLAVVGGHLRGLDEAVGTALRAAGHRVHHVPDLVDVVALARAEQVALVAVDGRTLAASEGAWGSVRVGGAELFAVHQQDDDLASWWGSYRRGAVPWVLGASSLPGLAPVGTFGGELALDALHEELLGRHADACRLVASIRDPALVAEVVEVLVAAGAAALERLRNRSRYPVPAELLVQHLPDHIGTLEGIDFSLWWNMVEAAAFRASGLRLPVPGADLVERPFAAAFGAFHATTTIVRFTARRQWRKPVDLLGDLAGVD